MSQEQVPRPVTYGDVFPNIQAEGAGLATQPVTMEDASLMQCAEALALRKTQKGGAASAMQSAASRNVDQGLVDREAHSVLAEHGMTVSHTAVPGVALDVSYVAGNPVQGTALPTPTDPAIAAHDAVTIGEALEAAAIGAGDKPIDESDARAILSAEARATGVPAPIRGGVGSVAQSAAELNTRVLYANEQTTIADLLMDATTALRTDKVVTHEDAEKVIQAELRHKPNSQGITEGGVGAAMAAAAELNERKGLIPSLTAIEPTLTQNTRLQEAVADDVEEEVVEVGRYYPVDTASNATVQPSLSAGDEDLSALLMGESNSEQQDAVESLSYFEQLEGLQVPLDSTPPPPHHREHVD